MRWSSAHRRSIVAAVMALQGIALLGGQQAAKAATAQLPFTVTNNSGRSDATYIYVVARSSSGQQGYVDAGGTWHAYPFPASIPPGTPNPAAPDVSIAGPANATSKTITLPPSLSGGRIYLSMGAKLQFFMTTNGLVEPAPWVSTDPNANVLYDWTEFARASSNGNGIFINSTTVDMFSLPLSVSVTSSAGATDTEGMTGNRTGIFNAVTALGGDWARLVQTRSADGLPLRVLAPVHGIQNGIFSTSYLDAYIAAAWTYYQTHTLTVDTAWGAMTGTVSGTTMTMKDPAGVVAGTLPRPTTADVFGCSGATQPAGQPNEPQALAFGARVCAAFHRATLSTASRVMFDHQPTTDPTTFYQQSASDLFSKVMHDNSLNGKAYGFAYDDVAAFAPTIDQPDPASAGMTIGSFGTGGGTGGTGGTVTGSTIVGPGGKCVDVAGDDTGVNNTAVQLWDCQATAVDQHWTLTGGTLRTLSRCLDITAGNTANGTKLQLYDCNGSAAQQWVTQADGSLKNPGSGRCVDSPSGATANGTRLQIYDCNASAAQKFSYNGGATVINGPGAKCVDVAGDDTGGNGTAVQLWDCQATAKDQQWTWSGGTLRTLSRCLDITGAGTANSTKLELWDCTGGAGQQWVQNADGTIRNPASARCMDATAGATTNGTRLQIYDCNASAAQVFRKA
jgi:hypothetical protein